MPRLEGLSITREQFLIREMRIVCGLKLDGLDDDEIIAKVKAENLIQYPTERTLANIARVCCKRIVALDSDALMRVIVEGDSEAAAQANLYAMMCTYPLVRHFMVTEVARHYAELDYRLGPVEMGAYMARLQAEFENIATATDASIAKIKQVLRNGLVACGMLENARSAELVPIFMDPAVRDAVEAKDDVAALAAFNCQGVM